MFHALLFLSLLFPSFYTCASIALILHEHLSIALNEICVSLPLWVTICLYGHTTQGDHFWPFPYPEKCIFAIFLYGHLPITQCCKFHVTLSSSYRFLNFCWFQLLDKQEYSLIIFFVGGKHLCFVSLPPYLSNSAKIEEKV